MIDGPGADLREAEPKRGPFMRSEIDGKCVPRWIALLVALATTLAASTATAWQVHNGTGAPLSVLVVGPGIFQSYASVAPGQSIACPAIFSFCAGTPARRDAPLVAVVQIAGAFDCRLPLLGDGSLFVEDQTRSELSFLMPPNLYCYTRFDENGTLPNDLPVDANGNGTIEEDVGLLSSDPYAGPRPPASIPVMSAANRDVRFLVTGDPQYDNAQLGPPHTGLAADSDRGIAAALALLASPEYRGVIVNGDITQNARGDDDGSLIQESDELDAYRDAIGPASHRFFEGLGNHDLDSSGASSAPEDMIRWAATKARNTVATFRPAPGSGSAPHYSWDWHDIHFVQLDLFPGNDPSPAKPIDPRDALDFLIADLALWVGTSGRPVVLLHHYGFDCFSMGTCSTHEVWWNEIERTLYWNALRDYNVLAIFNGHDHLGREAGSSWIVPWQKPAIGAARPDGRTSLRAFNAATLRGGVMLDVKADECNVMTIVRRDETGAAIPGQGQTFSFAAPTPRAASCAVCGDAVREGAESCDDGNADDDDGCSSACQTEPGWKCTVGTPWTCARLAVCDNGLDDDGDGLVDFAKDPGCAAQGAGSEDDRDGDGVDDPLDNCPRMANPSQLDRGGHGAGSAPDGIGDACQCGDASGDGFVTIGDAVMIARSLLAPPTAARAKPELCDVGGSPNPATLDCTLADAVVIRRALLVPPTAAIQQACPATR